MDKLLERISNYEFVNSIIPGFIVVKAIYFVIPEVLSVGSPLDTLLSYYIVGLVISRIASVIVEPLCKNSKIIKFALYEDYIYASEKKPMIKDLSTINNLYRNLLTAIITVTMMSFFKHWGDECFGWRVVVVGGLFVCLLLFSYRKQTDYVRKRVEFVMKNERGE